MISTFKPHIHQLLKIVLGTIFPNYCLHYQPGLQKKSTHTATLVSVDMWRNILLTNTAIRAALKIVTFVQTEYINLVGCMNEYMCIHVNMCVYVCIYMFMCLCVNIFMEFNKLFCSELNFISYGKKWLP